MIDLTVITVLREGGVELIRDPTRTPSTVVAFLSRRRPRPERGARRRTESDEWLSVANCFIFLEADGFWLTGLGGASGGRSEPVRRYKLRDKSGASVGRGCVCTELSESTRGLHGITELGAER